MKYSKRKFIQKERKLIIFSFLFWFVQWALWLVMEPEVIKKSNEFIVHSVQYFTPILLTILLGLYLQRRNTQKPTSATYVLIVILLSIVCSILWIIQTRLILYLLWSVLYDKAVNHHLLEAIWNRSFPFFVWSALVLSLKYYEAYKIQKNNAEKAFILAQNSQLEMLRYQLNPHFLFNTLSSLRALIRNKDNKTAENMVTKISEFLKYSLLEGENNKVPLAKEIKTINHYFDIEKVRFGDQLIVDYNIDPRSENYPVPVFIIHPLIENAVKHGMKTSKGPLHISLQAKMLNDTLIIEIINSGQWIEQNINDDSTHTGLENTRKRLKLAYSDNHKLEIVKKEEFVQIIIEIYKP